MKQEISNKYYRVSVKALVLDETRTKFLVIQEEGNLKWALPGGGLGWGESPVEALQRKIQSEMGLSVVSINPHPCYFFTSQMESGEGYRADVLFEAVLSDLNFISSRDCIAVRFVTPEEAMELDTFALAKNLARVFDPSRHTRK